MALIAANVLYQIFNYPTLSMIPLLLFTFAQASRTSISFTLWQHKITLPWGILVMGFTVALAWILDSMGSDEVSFAKGSFSDAVGFYYPRVVGFWSRCVFFPNLLFY